MKSPKPNKRTNHHKPQSTNTSQSMLASKKLLQRKNKYSPLNPTGSKIRKLKKVEHNHMPTNPSQCSRNTKQHSNEYVFHIPNRHTPTNKPPRPAGRQTNQHTTMHTKNKKYSGTLLSSQTSSPTKKKINLTLTSHRQPVQTYSTQRTKSNHRIKSVQNSLTSNLPATSRRLGLM